MDIWKMDMDVCIENRENTILYTSGSQEDSRGMSSESEQACADSTE
jgi:hypothetical protein